MPAADKPVEQKKVDAYVRLLVAEAEFLKANGWIPISPAVAGGDVRWRRPHDVELVLKTQNQAVEQQKCAERA